MCQEAQKGTRFGHAERQEENTSNKYCPAPDRYKILGDFDFKDLNDPNSIGKVPKFAYRIKPIIKS